MFTGIVACTGRIATERRGDAGARLRIESELGTLATGESVAVNGVCLTAVEPSANGFEVDLSSETLARTTLGRLGEGSRVNLERALTLADRLGGHWVTGHVDGLALVRALVAQGEAARVELTCPAELLRYVAPKGSLTLDGVSLTVNEVSGEGFSVMLIPHTLAVTTLGGLGVGASLNLEVDVLMRYVARWLEGAPVPSPPSS